MPIWAAVAGKALLDTGPLVALLSKRDDAHETCVEAFEAFRGHLFTTEPVMTEAMHLLGRQPGGPDACLEFFLRGGALIVPLDAQRIARCRELMARYADVPMDFADATLVALGEELNTAQIFTLDRRGFSVFRLKGRKLFVLIP